MNLTTTSDVDVVNLFRILSRWIDMRGFMGMKTVNMNTEGLHLEGLPGLVAVTF